ncbi:uncharacterized protein LOC132273155 [Cornus florida]|uniref:uncharacterized protein LOC132273155 n=1 Tax=Cornus florida TaxID=4283 RepID=UPI00289FEDBD|nr:uncharacterized protein LOC132273155 [Cornus florida]
MEVAAVGGRRDRSGCEDEDGRRDRCGYEIDPVTGCEDPVETIGSAPAKREMAYREDDCETPGFLDAGYLSFQPPQSPPSLFSISTLNFLSLSLLLQTTKSTRIRSSKPIYFSLSICLQESKVENPYRHIISDCSKNQNPYISVFIARCCPVVLVNVCCPAVLHHRHRYSAVTSSSVIDVVCRHRLLSCRPSVPHIVSIARIQFGFAVRKLQLPARCLSTLKLAPLPLSATANLVSIGPKHLEQGSRNMPPQSSGLFSEGRELMGMGGVGKKKIGGVAHTWIFGKNHCFRGV